MLVGRLPWVVVNVASLPPNFSTSEFSSAPKNMVTKYNLRLAFLAGVPFLICGVFSGVMLYSIDSRAADHGWQDLTEVSSCMHVVLEEASAAMSLTGSRFYPRYQETLRLTTFYTEAKAAVDTKCPASFASLKSKSPLFEIFDASGRGEMIALGEHSFVHKLAVSRGYVDSIAGHEDSTSTEMAAAFKGVYMEYKSLSDLLWEVFVHTLHGNSEEKGMVQLGSAYYLNNAVLADCEAIRQATILPYMNRFEPFLNKAPIILHEAAEHVFANVFRAIADPNAAAFTHVLSYPEKVVHSETRHTLEKDNPGTLYPDLRHYVSSFINDTAEAAGEDFLRIHITNRELSDRMWDMFDGSEIVELKEGSMEKDDKEARRLYPALSIASACVGLALCALLLSLKAIEVAWEVTLTKEFNQTDALTAHSKAICALQVDNFKPSVSSMENCFMTFGKALLELKPFVSHGLYESTVSADQAKSVGTVPYPTTSFAVRSEVGMFFTNCAVMCISTKMFDDVRAAEMGERAGDLLADFNALLAIVHDLVSKYQGVVYAVTPVSVSCTFNVSVLTPNDVCWCYPGGGVLQSFTKCHKISILCTTCHNFSQLFTTMYTVVKSCDFD